MTEIKSKNYSNFRITTPLRGKYPTRTSEVLINKENGSNKTNNNNNSNNKLYSVEDMENNLKSFKFVNNNNIGKR
jgi:hypothetical protein